MLRIPTLVSLAFLASAASAAHFDNQSGRYSFTPLPSAEAEMKRMNTIMELSDQQPTGRYVRKGETALTLCMPVTVKRTTTTDDGDETDVAFTRFVYKPHWFALSQTEGTDLEPLAMPS